MRIVVAECTVTYSGRGSTHLPRAVRAIFIKSDGAVSVHADTSNKPLNYMGAGNTFTEARQGRQTLWTFATRKEVIEVKIHRMVSDQTILLDGADPGLKRDGTEHHLQAWIAEHPECLGPGYTFVAREYPTGAGPVDLLVRDAEGLPVAVEVKRVAQGMNVVDQISRYVQALNELGELGTVTGMIAAFEIRPRTEERAARKNIATRVVSRDEFNS
jgi:RecB family endonuclease NucS